MSENQGISKRISKEKIKFTADFDLNSLFNLNYNFDLLKQIIEDLLANQDLLQDRMDKIEEGNKEKDERIAILEREVKELKEKQIDRAIIDKMREDIEEIKKHLQRHDNQIEDCKLKNKNITYLIYYL
ncbi:MAG: hypothetical protein MJ252_14095 [archaeon]|nr:hypothetical protein [archaeon]